MNITENEAKILAFMVRENGSCATTPEELKEDNMTWANQDDMLEGTDIAKRSLGGILASLSNKGLAVDSGETANNERRGSDWYLTDDGIDAGFAALERETELEN